MAPCVPPRSHPALCSHRPSGGTEEVLIGLLAGAALTCEPWKEEEGGGEELSTDLSNPEELRHGESTLHWSRDVKRGGDGPLVHIWMGEILMLNIATEATLCS